MSGEPAGHIVVDDFLDFEHPADASASQIYERLRAHARMREIITELRKRGLSDLEIRIVFRHVSRIPGQWELD